MRKLYIILLSILGLLFFPVIPIILIIVTLIYKISWWFLGGFIIFDFVSAIALVISYLIYLSIKKRPESKLRMSDKTAIEKAKKEWQYDTDNPDNFSIKDKIPMNIGEKGKERTPVLFLIGRGTETDNALVSIWNLNKRTSAKLINPNEQKIIETINSIADNPPDEKDVAKITRSLDAWGRPVVTEEIKKQSQAEKKAEEEKKKEDEVHGM